jgi:hypothetical protein
MKEEMMRLGFSYGAVLLVFTLICSGTETSLPLEDVGTARGGPVHGASRILDESVSGDDATAARVREAYGKLPLSFEGNRGQTDPEVKFLARGGGYTLFLTSKEAVLTLDRGGEAPDRFAGSESTQPAASAVHLQLLGANPAPSIDGQGDLAGRSHYFIGDDPRQWRHGIPHYERVRYEEVYPGIDLIYYGNQGRLEYDFVVGAHADPDAIRLEFPGAGGLVVDERGDLVLKLDGGDLVQKKPVIYQEAEGVRRDIEGGYRIDERSRVSIEVGAYDESRPLVIDPVLLYATYLGGAAATDIGDIGSGIAVDDAGSAYVIGLTRSLDFPTTAGAFQPVNGGGSDPRDVFVTKLNADGTGLVFSTFLGGSGIESGSIALDAAGAVYVAGFTSSPDFPTTAEACQRRMAGIGDAFVTRLNADGSGLVFSTYLGGSGQELVTGLATDAEGSVYLAGWTTSADFPTSTQALQPARAGMLDGFVAKLNERGSALVHSTYLGGSANDSVADLDLGEDGSVYVTGATGSVDFPISAEALQPAYARLGDAFVIKLNGSMKRILYSTYLGGSRNDQAHGIAVDASGSAHVTGITTSVDFPTTPDAFQPALAPSGNADTFVAKLASGGRHLVYSTYLGGGGDDIGQDIALDADGCAYVAGATNSLDFPTTAGALQPTNATPCFGNTCSDVFLTKLCDPGTVLSYSSYFGGSRQDQANGIALDRDGSVYLTGATSSFDLPATPGAAQPSNAGGPLARDVFVAKFGLGGGGGSAGDSAALHLGGSGGLSFGDLRLGGAPVRDVRPVDLQREARPGQTIPLATVLSVTPGSLSTAE